MIGPNIVQLENTVVCSGIASMTAPSGGAHVRSTGIWLPLTFVDTPAVTATVRAVTGPATAGVVFGIWSVEVEDQSNPGNTQVVIHAANVSSEGGPIDGDFVCDYVIVGNVK